MPRRPKKYEFKPIPGVKSGYMALSIYPPGQFIDNEDYAVFVGGGGVGHKKTLREAKAYLLARAKQECQYRIDNAKETVEHYERALTRLNDNGLEMKV